MEISVLKDLIYKESTNVVENVVELDVTKNKLFKTTNKFRDGSGIYERTGADFKSPVFSQSSEDAGEYITGTIVFKDGRISHTTETTAETQLSPQNYTSSPEPFAAVDMSDWTHRYIDIGFLDFATSSTITHSKTDSNGNGVLYWFSVVSIGGVPHIRYTIQYIESVTLSEGPFASSVPIDGTQGDDYYFHILEHQDLTYTALAMWGNVQVAIESDIAIRPTDGYTLTTPDGVKYTAGDMALDQWDDAHQEFRYVTKEEIKNTDKIFVSDTELYEHGDVNMFEVEPHCLLGSGCSLLFAGATFIVGSDSHIYMRSSATMDAEYVGVHSYLYRDVLLSDNWGWTRLSGNTPEKPFDNLAYTAIKQAGDFTLSFEVLYEIDVLGFSGVVAGEVIIEIPGNSGNPAYILSIAPDNTVDIDGRLPGYKTTEFAYLKYPFSGGVVKLHFKKGFDDLIEIGMVTGGLTADAGFTNLVLSNKFKDYSPYEKDKFGNILYVEGVKTNIYSGTVDIRISDYDRINRLMTSIGGKTVMLNGSDTTNNLPPDGKNVFASTRIIGRIRNFVLKTKLDNKLMSQMATYSFEIEEDV